MSVPIAPVRPALSPSPPREGGPAKSLAGTSTPAKRAVMVDRSRVDPATIQVAEGMESMFLDYMMKVMRQTVPENEMSMDSPATKIYQGMLDSEYAQKAARGGGFGLADQIIAYLESRRYTQRQGSGALPGVNRGTVRQQDPTGPARPTGGTNEGQSIDSTSSSER